MKFHGTLPLASLILLLCSRSAFPVTGPAPAGVDPGNALLQMGYLDVTAAPYFADPTGAIDATGAVQKAILDARDCGFVCFFPSGTYRISDTLNANLSVGKSAVTTQFDHGGKTQSYKNDRNRPCLLVGSRKKGRPVLKLGETAKGFDDAAKPKALVYFWAQSRDNVPGTSEPEWGKDQSSIHFNQSFRGIDLDVHGHSGAVGLRFAGSQGCSIEDVKVDAEGAFSGFYNIPGQAAGAHHIEVIGGDHAAYLESYTRFPIITGLSARGQRKAVITYVGPSTLAIDIVGFHAELDGAVFLEMKNNVKGSGASLIDGTILSKAQDPVMEGDANLYMENVYVRGVGKGIFKDKAGHISQNGTMIDAFAASRAKASYSFEGSEADPVLLKTSKSPEIPWAQIKAKHLWNDLTFPFFEDLDAVNIRTLGAKGDGMADDTAIFKAAIQKYPKVFVPRGSYVISETLVLGSRTALFGAGRIISEIKAAKGWNSGNTPLIHTVDDAEGETSLSHLSLLMPDEDPSFSWIHWKVGRKSMVRNIYTDYYGYNSKLSGNTLFFPIMITGNGGGKWFVINTSESIASRHSGHGDHRRILIEGTSQPLALYALNTERVTADYQMEIRDSRNVSIYYYKSENLELNAAKPSPKAPDCPQLLVKNSHGIRIHGMNGNLALQDERACITLQDSSNVIVTAIGSMISPPKTKFYFVKVTGNTEWTFPADQEVSIVYLK